MVKIKICGITNSIDAVNAANLGADYIGFNFYKYSPRYVEKSKARRAINKLQNVKSVGVFVNEKIDAIKKIVEFCNLDLVQLSGDENQSFTLNLKNILGREIIKSFRVKSRDDVRNIQNYKTDYIMLDSFKKGFYGGTGAKFEWSIAKYVGRGKLFLSGGLNALNVKSAVQEIKPYAVDVCSSIEVSPGKKDIEKMKEFIEAAK